MIKHVKDYKSNALINSEKYKQYVENFESEILRGISKLITLYAIKHTGEEGIYGYKLTRDLKEVTDKALIIEEGTLYPLLRKLKSDGLLQTEKKEYSGRLRTYYTLTLQGKQIYNHLMGFLTNLIEKISQIMEIDVKLNEKQYLICPNCSNRIEIEKISQDYCEACGLNLSNFNNYIEIEGVKK